MHRSGVLNLAPNQSPFIQNVIDSATRWQLNIEVMQPDDVRKRWPQINVPEGYLGVFEPQSGYLKCEQAVRSWIQLAEQAGCAQLVNWSVSELGRDCALTQVAT